jgi:hypothetical protein
MTGANIYRDRAMCPTNQGQVEHNKYCYIHTADDGQTKSLFVVKALAGFIPYNIRAARYFIDAGWDAKGHVDNPAWAVALLADSGAATPRLCLPTLDT